MPQSNSTKLHWQVPEYRVPDRSRTWYIIAAIFIFICLFLSFFTISAWHISFLGYNSNFLFAIIILISAAIMYINETREPEMIEIDLGPEGVKVGGKFYEYTEFKNFSVLYKPKQSLKSLYFEFKRSTHPRISIPLRRMDALTVRSFLVRYIDEDLERENQPLSEQLTKLLKL